MTYARVEIGEDSAGNIFTAARLGEEGLVDAVGASIAGVVGVNSPIRPEAVLQKVPAFAVRVSPGSFCDLRSCITSD